jgi:hypothetical protein
LIAARVNAGLVVITQDTLSAMDRLRIVFTLFGVDAMAHTYVCITYVVCKVIALDVPDYVSIVQMYEISGHVSNRTKGNTMRARIVCRRYSLNIGQ